MGDHIRKEVEKLLCFDQSKTDECMECYQGQSGKISLFKKLASFNINDDPIFQMLIKLQKQGNVALGAQLAIVGIYKLIVFQYGSNKKQKIDILNILEEFNKKLKINLNGFEDSLKKIIQDYKYQNNTYQQTLKTIKKSQYWNQLQFQTQQCQKFMNKVGQNNIENKCQLFRWMKNIFKGYEKDNGEDEIQSLIYNVIKIPKLYEQYLRQCFGKKISKDIIQKFKKSSIFQIVLAESNLKIIHSIPTADVKLGEDKNFLYYFPFKITEWEFKHIAIEIEKSQSTMFRQALQKMTHPTDFFAFIDKYVLDFLTRRLNITELISLLNQQAIKNDKMDNDIRNMFKKITATDLVAIFSKLISSKQYFGSLLHRVSFPIPLVFKTLTKNGPIEFYQPQLLEQILRTMDFNLVTNLGSIGTVGKGKTTFLKEFYLLKQKYLNSPISEFHEGAVDFYTNVPVSHSCNNKRHTILADFQGDWTLHLQFSNFKIVMQKWIQNSEVVYFHLNKNQLASQDFIKQINNLLLPLFSESKAKLLFLVRDSENELQVRKFQGFAAISIPNIQKEAPPEFTLISKQIIKIIQTQNLSHPKLQFSLFIPNKNAQIQYTNRNTKIQKIIQILQKHPQRNTFYQTMFPKLDNMFKISELNKQILILENSQYVKNINVELCSKNILTKKKKIQQLKNKKIQSSNFLKAVIGQLKQDFSFIQKLSDALALWRNNETESIQKELFEKKAEYEKLNVKKSSQKQYPQKEKSPITNKQVSSSKIQSEQEQKNKTILEQLNKNIKQLEQKLQTYDVSVDTIFAEVISQQNNKFQDKEVKIGQKNQNTEFLNENVRLIDQYYRKLYQNVTPINLIEGKTLEYGNPYLSNLFEKLNQTNLKDKEIFVISVMGAQSSAKSTLMNYLFKCNFATSAGRCTKGVYFTIVECNKKAIIVIDTEGLLSVLARDNIFDVQIACFVMLISDLVIVNNKGQINSILRNLLGVCLYAIHELTSSKQQKQQHNIKQSTKESLLFQKEKYQPNQIIFAIRDQKDDGASKQKQRLMVSKIRQALQQHTQIDYRRYIKFADSDVLLLQSAFINQNFGVISIQEANNSFGKNILAFRSKIVDNLKNPKNKSVYSFYTNSNEYWKAIISCGKDIFNFKSILQVQIKSNMKITLYKIFQTEGQILRQLQKKKITLFVKNQSEIQNQLRIIFQQGKKTMKQKFLKQFETNPREWVQYFYPQIDFQNKRYYDICLNRVRQDISYQNDKKKKRQFQQSMNKVLDENLYKQNITKSDIITLLQQKQQQLLQPSKGKIEEIQLNLKQKLGSTYQSYTIKNIIKSELTAFFQSQGITGFNLETLIQDSKILTNLSKQKGKKEKICSYFFDQKKLVKSQQLFKNNVVQIFKIVQKYMTQSLDNIDQIVQKQKSTNLQNIQNLAQMAITKLTQAFDCFAKSNNVLKYNLTLKKKGIIIGIFISTLPEKIQIKINKNILKKCQEQYDQRKKMISNFKRQIQISFQVKGNVQKTAQIWIEKILERQIEKVFQSSKKRLLESLDIVNSNLQPQALIKNVMNRSFYSEHTMNKTRLAQCYKVIANINQYIKQIFREQPNIQSLDLKISQQHQTMQKSMNQFRSNTLKYFEDQTQVKNVKYYAEYFRIDLILYDNKVTNQNIKKIILVIEKRFKEYQTYEKRILQQLNQKQKNLRQLANNYLKTKVEPMSIGCQKRCPGCKMKCKKNASHLGGHEVIEKTHLLACFTGFYSAKDNTRSHGLCYTENLVKNTHITQDNQRYPFLQWIKKFYPSWSKHFESGVYSGEQRRIQYQRIWRGIGDMLIKNVFGPDVIVINDTTPQPDEQYLTEEDIQKYQLKNYHNK